MQEGGFYCYVPRSPGLWLLSRSHSEKLVHKRIDAVLSRSSSIQDDIPDSSGAVAASLLRRQSSSTYVFPGGGLTVRQGVYELTSDIPIYRVQPYIYEADGCVVVFYGYLSNLSELAHSMAQQLDTALLEEMSTNVGPLTASIILELYLQQRDGSDGSELLLLSEIQGQFSFVVYDSKRRWVFAARDPSGREPLYYCADEDGGVSFTNTPDTGCQESQTSGWEEVPPGFFMAGKSPKLQQFALTHAELQARELLEHLDSSLSLSDEDVVSPKAGSARRSRGGGLSRRNSQDRSCHRASTAEAEMQLFQIDDE